METSHEEWEYLVKVLSSRSEAQADFLQQKYPNLNLRAFSRYTPYALQPQLDAFGKQGWELVSLQPVMIGDNGDAFLGGGDRREWATEYLCVFKRQLLPSVPPAASD